MGFVRGRVLDVGCGAGRHALHLQGLGHEVVGVDVSPGAVEVSRRRGVRDVRPLSVTQLSRRRLGTFDTVLLMGANFGLLANERRARWLLRRFHGMTSPTGRIVAETRDPYDTARPEHRAYHVRNRERGRMGGQIRLRVRYRTRRTPWFDYLFVSRAEMESLVARTGWRIAHILSSRGPDYIAILEKG